MACIKVLHAASCALDARYTRHAADFLLSAVTYSSTQIQLCYSHRLPRSISILEPCLYGLHTEHLCNKKGQKAVAG